MTTPCLWLPVLAAACSTPDSGSADAALDSGSTDAALEQSAYVTGSITGWNQAVNREEWTLDPKTTIAGIDDAYQFVFAKLTTEHHAISISDFDDYCGNEEDPLGRTLYLDLFDNPSGPDSRVHSPGVFEAWSPGLQETNIPDDKRVIAIVRESHEDGGAIIRAQAGTVEGP